MSAHEELDPELKRLEAELACLVPRADRLDRERLAFLAGQQSVAAAGIRRWLWPAGCAATTVVAGWLLVILVFQPGPRVIVRYIERPAHAADLHSPGGATPATADRSGGPTPSDRDTSPGLEYERGILALAGLKWPADSLSRHWARAPYFCLLEQTLEGRYQPAPVTVVSLPEQAAEVPATSRRMLRSLLENQTSGTSQPAPPEAVPPEVVPPAIENLFSPGANS
jgi:hypothetical protein